MNAGGKHICDGCGTDVGNGAVTVCATISTLNPRNPTEPVVLHLCRKPRKGAPRGCEGLRLGPAALANFYDTRTTST